VLLKENFESLECSVLSYCIKTKQVSKLSLGFIHRKVTQNSKLHIQNYSLWHEIRQFFIQETVKSKGIYHQL